MIEQIEIDPADLVVHHGVNYSEGDAEQIPVGGWVPRETS